MVDTKKVQVLEEVLTWVKTSKFMEKVKVDGRKSPWRYVVAAKVNESQQVK